MKSKIKQGALRFPLSILYHGNAYFIERIAALEEILAKKPARLQIEMMGEGEIAADWALLIRSILSQRSPKTRIITCARSSLRNGSVLVWLLGDQRVIREDARVFFRAANLETIDPEFALWKDKTLGTGNSGSEIDPEEYDHARVLELINEFLPVNELCGKVIGLPVLRQFGLVDNETLDRFLATALGKSEDIQARAETKRVRGETKVTQK